LTLAGIRRRLGTRQRGKEPTLTADIAAMTSALPRNLIGKRNRAILLVGYAAALRRSELVSINVEDLAFTVDGIRLTIPKSKTDQEGEGQVIGIAAGTALCPVRALREWLDASKISSGAVFRRVSRFGTVGSGRLTDQVVANVVKVGAARVGLDPKKYAGHSLRAGLVTQAAINNVPEHRIMRQTRHKSADMVRRYIRDVDLLRNSASAALGL
jgi:integrase